MQSSTKQQVAASFSRAGSTYALAARIQRRVAFECAEAVPVGRYPLAVEIGTGVGALCSFLRPRALWNAYVGVDIAEGMIRSIPVREPSGLYVVADGEQMPLAEGGADLLVSASTMQWYRDPAHSIPENLRLLASGGRFSFAIFVSGTLRELGQASRETGFGQVFTLRDAQEYEWMFSGFSCVEYESHVWETTLPYPSVRALLRELRQTGVTGAGSGRAYSRSRYMAFCKRYEELCGGEEGVFATWRTFFVSGRKK